MSNGDILSEAEVEFLLNSAGADEPSAAAPPTLDEQSVTMRGDLEQINLADIFQTLAMSKMEGVLRLRNPLEERYLHCRDGSVRTHVGKRLVTRRLGQRLVQAGLVTPDQLRMALEAQRQVKRPIGQLLVDAGCVTQEAIDNILGTQIAEDLFTLFTWRHGTFEFFKGPPTAPGAADPFAACPEYEVNSLLLEVARRSDEWESIFAAIGSLDEVPIQVAEPSADAELGECHRALLAAAKGEQRYREIADQLTFGLFEVARAARDLIREHLIACLDDGPMVALANQRIQLGEKKQGIILLQTLRDRPNDRAIGVLQGMAKALETAGESRMAGALLVEAAQRQGDSAAALEMARAAQKLCPHDAATLSFLRTILVAHAPADSPELERCTLDLLDALIEADLIPTVLDIVEDARRTGTMRAEILVREVRARQKARDPAGACQVLEELSHHHDQAGNPRAANEALDALLRIDRSRTDIRRLLAARRRTRLGRIVRIAGTITALVMAAGSGIVFWQQHEQASNARAADQEISALLQAGDRPAARLRLDHWSTVLGECEPIEDLRNRIAFAEATESGRKQKLLRTRVNAELTAAAALLGEGKLAASISAYMAIAAEPGCRDEVIGVVVSRLDALANDVARVGRTLLQRLPPPPKDQFSRTELQQHNAEFQTTCPPLLVRSFHDLALLVEQNELPDCLPPELQARLTSLVAESRTAFARARELQEAYAQALARNDLQRQLDPVFKAAVDCEARHDFAGALARYRELEQQQATAGDLRTHFRDRVARNATIVRLMEALRTATKAGDFATASQHLRALRLSFPDVPFERLVALPLLLDSQPRGAHVRRGSEDVGVTPLLLERVPAETMQISMSAPGFRDDRVTITGETDGAYTGYLLLEPTTKFAHDSMVEVPPLTNGDSHLLVDRAGKVTLRDATGTVRWTFRSGDLSGLLTAAVAYSGHIYFGSLDGDLRCLDQASGDLVWTLPDLPTEVAPLLVGNQLVVATTTATLTAVDLDRGTSVQVKLPEPPRVLMRHGSTIAVLGERGSVATFLLQGLQTRWQRTLPDAHVADAALVDDCVVVADERGHASAIDLRSGDVRWQRAFERELFGAPTTDGHQILLMAREQVLCIDPATGLDRATVALPGVHPVSAAQVVGNRLVVPIRGGQLQVLDLKDCSPLYRIRCEHRGRALVRGTSLYVIDPDHQIQVFNPMR